MHELNKIISKIDVLLPPMEYIKSILHTMCDYLGYAFATVIEVDESGSGKMLVSCNMPHDYFERIAGVGVPLLSSPSGEAIETGRIVVVADPLAEPRLLPWIDIMQDYSILTQVWVPLFRAGKTFGTCVLYDTKKRDVLDGELEALEQIGVMVSISITSNQYLSELSTEIEERKGVEEKLRQLRDELEVQVESRTIELSKANVGLQLFRNLMVQSNDGIFIVDPDTGQFLDINESACLNLGYKREDILGKTVLDIDPMILDMSMWAQRIEKVREKGHMVFEGVHQRKDGTIFPVEINVKYIDYGQNKYLVTIVRDIAERKRAEVILHESRNRFESIYSHSPIGIELYDSSGHLVTANPKCLEIFGVNSVEEIRGFQLFEDPSIEDDLKEKLKNGMNIEYQSVFDFGLVKEMELYETTKSGSCHLDVAISPFKIDEDSIAGYLVHVKDISAQKQAEDDRLESERRYRGVFNSANDGIFIHDLDGQFIDANDVACKLLGHTHDELVQMTVMDLHTSQNASRIKHRLLDVLTHDSITNEANIAQSGKVMCVEIKSQLIEYGKDSVILSIARDITKRKRMEDELKSSHQALEQRVAERTENLEKINRELSDANVKLHEVDLMKSEFLDTVSHELRTPLTSIIGYSGLLLDGIQGEMSEKQTQYVEGIWRRGLHQLQLVNDILDLSKLESKHMAVNLEAVPVLNSIKDVMVDAMPLIKDKQHETAIEIADEVGDVCADRIRLKQVLLNLVSNAIKFTPDKGRIVVKAGDEGGMVRISVIDNGIGINKEDLDKLFNRFIQVDQSNTRRVGGTGLGLAIVKDIMELMGGSVEVDSEFGKGSTFSILLPMAQSSDRNNE